MRKLNMEWAKLLNFDRLGPLQEKSYLDVRNEPSRDIDRITFSGAFRRLSRKTQVHPLAANDHIHTRLTHSIEVARVGASIAKKVYSEIKEEIPDNVTEEEFCAVVQAACLAHDIGNPPFGHAGEEAMMSWFENNNNQLEGFTDEQKIEMNKFDGNAQGFRMITQTENHLFNGGLRLTYATLATFLKYPHTPQKDTKKFSVFLTERDILDEVAGKVGLIKNNNGYGYVRHPLAYLAEAADDICYCVLDLEDAVELKILSYKDVEEVLLSVFVDSEKQNILDRREAKSMFRVNLARLRGPVFDALTDTAASQFVKSYNEIMSGEQVGDLLANLEGNNLSKKFVSDAKDKCRDNVFRDNKKVEVELGCFATFDTLLSHMIPASQLSTNGLAWKNKLVMNLLGDHAPKEGNGPNDGKWDNYQRFRRATDYVSGMTDNYAIYIAKQLQGFGFTGDQRP